MKKNLTTILPKERTQEVFEYIRCYPKPPLVPLADLHNSNAWEQAGFKNLEKVLWDYNHQLPELFTVLISATLTIKDDPGCCSPMERPASLILAARSLCRDLSSGQLEPDRFKESIMEMGKYPNLFSTCLIPEKKEFVFFKSQETS